MALNRSKRVSLRKKKMLPWSKIGRSLITVDPLPDKGTIFYLENTEEIKNNYSEGCTCEKCGQFNEYAEPNQNNNSFICFGCRSKL